jgi:hypothetical protein
MYLSAHCLKVIALAFSTFLCRRPASRAARGLIPSPSRLRACCAFSRALARLVVLRGPSPMLSALPLIMKRKSQDLVL